jgi:hypothetical protein
MINQPKAVILHCSATADYGDDIGAKEIRNWHMYENGWSDIGYHYVLRRNGIIEAGRPEQIKAAHTYGHNQDTLGVCYVGTYKPTIMQLESLISLYMLFKNKYQIGYLDWHGHNDFSSKQCPGFYIGLIRNMFKYADRYKQVINKR